MGLSKFMLVFFFFFYLYRIKLYSAEVCAPHFASCAIGDGPFIQFPFSVQYYGSCAYPGFNMSCTDMNTMSIQIGLWGEFFVKDVDYLEQKVRIYDQHKCLPKRLLNIDLSGSPFRGDHYKNFTFYNCSSEFSTNVSTPISCLSTRNHTVFASSNSSSRKMFSACNVIASIMVPSLSGSQNDEINNDLLLVWDTPDCRECLGQKYADCGFKNTESRELKCFLPLSPDEHGHSKTRKQAIVLGVCIPILVGVVLTICCIFGRRRLYNTSDLDLTGMRPVTPYLRDMEEPTGSVIGLDESVIQSYPKTVLGESGRLAKPEDNTCSICLSDYEAKETVKTVPDCKHCFHAACIDEWLRKNVTCPLCRNPPMSSPLAA